MQSIYCDKDAAFSKWMSVIKGYLVEIAPNGDLRKRVRKEGMNKQRKEDEGKTIVNNEEKYT